MLKTPEVTPHCTFMDHTGLCLSCRDSNTGTQFTMHKIFLPLLRLNSHKLLNTVSYQRSWKIYLPYKKCYTLNITWFPKFHPTIIIMLLTDKSWYTVHVCSINQKLPLFSEATFKQFYVHACIRLWPWKLLLDHLWYRTLYFAIQQMPNLSALVS